MFTHCMLRDQETSERPFHLQPLPPLERGSVAALQQRRLLGSQVPSGLGCPQSETNSTQTPLNIDYESFLQPPEEFYAFMFFTLKLIECFQTFN